jgi:putative ABC transport system permease protein
VIRIALQMLFGDATKCLGVVLGIFLSTFLITHMLGMFNGMMERTYGLITDIPLADVWVMDPAVEYVDGPAGLPPTTLDRVRGVEGVDWATPLISITLPVKLPGGVLRSALVLGLDDATFVGAPANVVQGSIEDLRTLDSVIVDTLSARGLLRTPVDPRAHPLPDTSSPQDAETRPLIVGDEFFVNDHRLVVRGLAKLGPQFLSRPVMFMTRSRVQTIAPPQRNLPSFVLVHAKAGVDPTALASTINRVTGLRARTAKQFSDDTYWYFVKTTGVVDRIAFMVSVGLVVGISVSALLLYLFTSENAWAYALMNAMGAQRSTITLMVIVQAVVCGLLGYGLGTGASCALGRYFPTDTLPYLAIWQTMLAAGGAVLAICVIASMLSLRRVFAVEPAMTFRQR